MYRFDKLENLLERTEEKIALTPPVVTRKSESDFWGAIKEKLDEIQRAAINAGSDR